MTISRRDWLGGAAAAGAMMAGGRPFAAVAQQPAKGLIAQDMKKPPLEESLLKNVFFDTCVYHKPGMELLFKVVPVENILFASEMVGAVRGIDPFTGNSYDDTKRYVDGLALTEEDRRKVFETNARRVYRLDRADYFRRKGDGPRHRHSHPVPIARVMRVSGAPTRK